MTTASRRGAAVLGSPIAHSLSPVLHQAAYNELGLTDWTYQAVECTAADLADALSQLDTEGLAGASLTMPLKRAVMPLLASVDDAARTVGAANTVIFGAGGSGWSGSNTDVPGMVAALKPAMGGIAEGQTAVVLGAGATAASAIAAIARFPFKGVVGYARRPEVAAALEPLAHSLALDFEVRPWDDIEAAADAPLVISTTPAGASGALAAALGSAPGVLFDVIYSPWPTPLATAWQAAGGVVIGGLELLVEQAALQVELMTGRTAPVDAMRAAGYAVLQANR
jgi:shikimate dehydrogenase